MLACGWSTWILSGHERVLGNGNIRLVKTRTEIWMLGEVGVLSIYTEWMPQVE
jgi:hypothetical protein